MTSASILGAPVTNDAVQPLEPNTGAILPLLALETLDDNLFRNRVNDVNLSGALFGGQVLSQALHAAAKTVDLWSPHSLHAYFLRRGDGKNPVIYQVERTRDGGSFSSRRVSAFQHGVPILHMEASFHAGDSGFDYQAKPSLSVPDPDGLKTLAELVDAFGDRFDPAATNRLRNFRTLEIKPTDPEALFRRSDVARSSFWVRIPSASGLSPLLQSCAMTYASDSWLAATVRRLHVPPASLSEVQLASLDHAMWFHAPVLADEWILYETDSPWTGAGRGLARGMLFDRRGQLLASIAQEVLLRRRKAT